MQASTALIGLGCSEIDMSCYDPLWGVTQPPPELLQQIFPFLEEALAKVEKVRWQGANTAAKRAATDQPSDDLSLETVVFSGCSTTGRQHNGHVSGASWRPVTMRRSWTRRTPMRWDVSVRGH